MRRLGAPFFHQVGSFLPSQDDGYVTALGQLLETGGMKGKKANKKGPLRPLLSSQDFLFFLWCLGPLSGVEEQRHAALPTLGRRKNTLVGKRKDDFHSSAPQFRSQASRHLPSWAPDLGSVEILIPQSMELARGGFLNLEASIAKCSFITIKPNKKSLKHQFTRA